MPVRCTETEPIVDGRSSRSSHPAKIIRIGAMVKQLLEEVRNTSLDEAAREQLRDIYENSLAELRTALSPELGDELDRLALDFDDDTDPDARRSCGWPRRSWSGGSRGCSTASRPR